MKKFMLSLGVGFVGNNIVGTLIAMLILAPLLGPMFGETLRPEDELHFPSLLGGYFIQTLLMVTGYQYFSFKANWLKQGIAWGAFCGGLASLSDHLITAGWSVLPPIPMFISGILDIMAAVATGIIIAYFYRNGKQVRDHSSASR
jgi:uncharacterized integral membrane protein